MGKFVTESQISSPLLAAHLVGVGVYVFHPSRMLMNNEKPKFLQQLSGHHERCVPCRWETVCAAKNINRHNRTLDSLSPNSTPTHCFVQFAAAITKCGVLFKRRCTDVKQQLPRCDGG